MTNWKYDVAFSFLARDEQLATQLDELIRDRLETFLYSKKQEAVAGTDGEKTFSEVFGKESRTVVVLYRDGWGDTPWTRIEATAIRNRAYDEGYDFALFIPLDDQAKMPPWLPKTQIYVGLYRWGVQSTAAVIEARATETGAETSPETAATHLERLKRSQEFEERRKKLLNSEQGVKTAQEVYAQVEAALRSGLEQAGLGASLVIRKHGNYLVLSGFGISLALSWSCHYSNSLDQALLQCAVYNGHPEFPGLTIFERARLIEQHEFQFDLRPNDQFVWRKQRDGHTHTATSLAAWLVRRFCENVDATQRRERA